MLSGSLYNGLPQNKITIPHLGEKNQHKTFFSRWVWLKTFLDQHENGGTLYILNQKTITKQMVIDRGIDAT